MIDFKDFAPRQVTPAGFLQAAEYESFAPVLQDMNRWIQESGVRVITIETVVLPNMHDYNEEGTEDPDIHTSGKMSASWHQFIRVWYEPLSL